MGREGLTHSLTHTQRHRHTARGRRISLLLHFSNPLALLLHTSKTFQVGAPPGKPPRRQNPQSGSSRGNACSGLRAKTQPRDYTRLHWKKQNEAVNEGHGTRNPVFPWLGTLVPFFLFSFLSFLHLVFPSPAHRRRRLKSRAQVGWKTSTRSTTA